MLGDHLMDMTGRRTECEQSRADDSRKTKIETSECGQEADNGEAQTSRGDFELERTVSPTNEGRRHPPEEGMHHEVVEIANADGPEHVPGKQLFDDERLTDR